MLELAHKLADSDAKFFGGWYWQEQKHIFISLRRLWIIRCCWRRNANQSSV